MAQGLNQKIGTVIECTLNIVHMTWTCVKKSTLPSYFLPSVLSVTVGSCQLTLTLTDVRLSITMSFGQYVNTGGSWSRSKVIQYM